MAHSKRGWLQYLSDPAPFGGATFSIKADATTASNNGQSLTPSPGVLNFWPGHTADMRAVYGSDSLGVRDSCRATSSGSPIFSLGATFADNVGNSYIVNGLRNERFRVRDLK